MASKTKIKSHKIIHSLLLSYPERWGRPSSHGDQHRGTDCGLMVTLMLEEEEGEGALGDGNRLVGCSLLV